MTATKNAQKNAHGQRGRPPNYAAMADELMSIAETLITQSDTKGGPEMVEKANRIRALAEEIRLSET